MGAAHASSSSSPSPSPPRPCHALFTYIIPVFISLITFGVAAGCRRKGELRFWQNSPDFRVALFADLHYGETAWTDWGPLQDVKSDIVISNVLDAEAPDFVIYLGDVITANNLPTPNASLYWDKAISPTRRRRIPWATVFGNHDDASFEWPSDWFSPTGTPPLLCSTLHKKCLGHDSSCGIGGVHRIELVEKEVHNNKMSYTQIGHSELWPSVSNYYLRLKSSEDSKQSTVALFYFLDSGGGSYPEVISSAQASWFLNRSQELNPNSNIPEIIFWHIPSKAYKEAAPKGKINKPCVGSINMEEVAAQEAEWGIMDIISKRPTVKAIFVGHNHGLDWCCPYKTLWLCYARHSGYGGYGDWPRGARIIEITQKPFSLKSWIRMEDGQKHSEIILN